MKRIGLAFTGSEPIGRYAEVANAAEERGFESFWIAEDYFFRDSVSTAGYLAGATDAIDLGVFVNAYTRHPALLAMTMASLHEMTDGRVSVAMGAGSPSVMERIVPFERPVGRVKCSAELLNTLLAGGSYTGRCGPFDLDGVTIGESPLLPFMGSFEAFDDDVVTYIAGKGPQMVRMAGDIGDGFAISVGYSPGMVADAVEQVNRGLSIRDRDRTAFDIAGFVFCTEEIDDRAREFATRYIANTPDPESLHLEGVAMERVAEFQQFAEEEGLDAARERVTDDMVRSLVVTGDLDDCCDRIDVYVEAGMDVPILTYLGPEPPEFLLDVGESWATTAY